ncbi:autotransporter outer membrane beta-barrel domain-containing protein [Chlorobium sp. N1]|uniref:autotransporter outer membrane beta-barrel domain-containing protein n=1 Tax=Chlorobium sp. N1 TaxID=2491138 RepID=UPI00103E1B44|nr:autotransporter outer membrane beta-barrel domain-containing protein [Chlorobium sp. N1]TCD47838.1 autotransporter outer membrane beta-barrel domain-containing protein [Chlorobium sp. N1]
MNRRFLRLLLFLSMCFPDELAAGEFTVTSSADTGDGTLRDAITKVNDSGDASNVITFAASTVTVSSKLPELAHDVAFVIPASGVRVVGETGYNSALFMWQSPATISLPSSGYFETSASSNVSVVRGKDDLTIRGDLAGEFHASGDSQYVYGVRSDSALFVKGDVSATIAVNAGSRGASALYSATAARIDGSVTGNLAATTGTYGARGIYSASGLTVSGDLGGTISATAGSYDACGLKVEGSLAVGGDISGTITATTLDGDGAYAIRAKSAVSLTGAVTGTLSATASGSDAAGLYCFESAIHGASSSDPLRISGTITAASSGASAAVMAWNEMNLYVTGTLTATGSSAYAIRSGMFDGKGGFTDNTESRTDTVVLASGAVLTGGVYLGDGDDSLTLSGTADISGVGALEGGTGDDRLVFSSWSGAYSSAMTGWEHLDVGSGSSLSMGALGSFSGELSVLEGAVLRPGSAGGGDRVSGSLSNKGLVDLRDGRAGGSLTVAGSYAGGGSVGLDIGAGSSDTLILSGSVTDSTVLLLSVLPTVTELASAEPSLLVHTDAVVAEEAFSVVDATDYGPYVAGVSVVQDAASGTDWYYGVGGLHDEAYAAQAVMAFVAEPLEELVPRFPERHAYGGAAGVMPEFGGGWARAGHSSLRTVLEGDAGSVTDGSMRFVELGWDAWHGHGGRSSWGAGVFGGTGTQSGTLTAADGRAAGGLEGTFYAGGLYAFLVRPGAWRLEASFGGVLSEGEVRYEDDPKEGYSTEGSLGSLEAAAQFGLGRGVALTSRVQGIWRHMDGFGLSPASTGPLEIPDGNGAEGLFGLGLAVNTDCPGWYLVMEGTARWDGSPENSVRYPASGVTLMTEGDELLWGANLTLGNRSGGALDPVYWVSAGAEGSGGSGGSRTLSVGAGVRVPF